MTATTTRGDRVWSKSDNDQTRHGLKETRVEHGDAEAGRNAERSLSARRASSPAAWLQPPLGPFPLRASPCLGVSVFNPSLRNLRYLACADSAGNQPRPVFVVSSVETSEGEPQIDDARFAFAQFETKRRARELLQSIRIELLALLEVFEGDREIAAGRQAADLVAACLLYTSPSPRD